MVTSKIHRRKLKLPSLQKLSLDAKDIDPARPVSPANGNHDTVHRPQFNMEGAFNVPAQKRLVSVHRPEQLSMKGSNDGLPAAKPVQSNGGFCSKQRIKGRKMSKSLKPYQGPLARRTVAKRLFTERKRKRQLLSSQATSEYSFTNSPQPSDNLSYSTSDSDSKSSYSHDDYSCTLDDGSEYYYTSYSFDCHEDGSSSYSDTYSEAGTWPCFAWDVPDHHKGAGQWHPGNDRRILGKGGFAVVYLSYSKASKKYYAVKCANGRRISALKSLTREADILKNLNSPYIIEYLGECRVPVTLKVAGTGSRPKSVPMVTEIYLSYMKRGSLADVIRKCRQKQRMMKESVIRTYTLQILRGLSYLHSKNIVHCDLKASNILVGKTRLKISDFGCSKNNIPTQNSLISRAGTRAWMAPEVRMRADQGFPADVWSLGCTVVQMITGHAPVSKGLLPLLHLHTEQPDAVVIPKDFNHLSLECIDFLQKCFLDAPKARWTCEQLLDHPFLKAK